MPDRENGRDKPLYMISVAAELTGMHPQTLRVYEQKGLVTPGRSRGNTRLYSQADIDRLDLIKEDVAAPFSFRCKIDADVKYGLT
ncbi:MAG: MerR family transcriptional regulator, partial [Atopobiaceae bacterium]|nr:MerR family transcriptional regulator [Atopobiaceae bacterium]